MVRSDAYSQRILRVVHEHLSEQQLLNGGFDVPSRCTTRLPLVPQHGTRLRNRWHRVTQPGDHLLRFDSCVPALPREVDVVGIVGIVCRDG